LTRKLFNTKIGCSCTFVGDGNIALKPCAYLHNYEDNDVINHSFYQEHTKKAPSFLKNDVQQLQHFIKQYVKYRDVVAINLLVELTKRELLTQYITKMPRHAKCM